MGTADGARVIFGAGQKRILWTRADGSGSIETVLDGDDVKYPTSVSPDGRTLAFYKNDPKTHRDLWVLPMDGQRKAVPFLATSFEENAPMFSPDGRWLAYVSNKSGRNEVYVRPYPGGGPQEYAISTEGGGEPVWAPSGRELFNRHDDDVMVVMVSTATTFMAARPARLFAGRFEHDDSSTRSIANYDISRDGKRFVMVKAVAQASETTQSPPITVILNWLEDVEGARAAEMTHAPPAGRASFPRCLYRRSSSTLTTLRR